MLKFVSKVLASFAICTIANKGLKALHKPKKYSFDEARELFSDLPNDEQVAILMALGYIPNPVPGK